MRKRLSIIFTITAAAVLVSSIAYASKKKLRPKSVHLNPDISEVDLAANLLDAKGGHRLTAPKEIGTHMQGDEELKDLTMFDKPGKYRQEEKSGRSGDSADR